MLSLLFIILCCERMTAFESIFQSTELASCYHSTRFSRFLCCYCKTSGSAGDVLEDDPVGRLKVYVYELPTKYNRKMVAKDSRCLSHMFAAEIFMHRFLLSSAIRTLNPEEADWFYTPVYTTCDLTPWGHPLPFKSPRIMRSAIQFISKRWPYWNRTEGADHFFVVPHDFGACFHYQVSCRDVDDFLYITNQSIEWKLLYKPIKLKLQTRDYFPYSASVSHLPLFAFRIIHLTFLKKNTYCSGREGY
jgi:hypothetical protein